MPRIIRPTLRRRRAEDSDAGFTLIELLVVVLIMGVLAAIAIPAFLAQREAAFLATVKSDLRNATAAAESYAALNSGYTGLDSDALQANGYNPSEDVSVAVALDAGTYRLIASSSSFSPVRSWTYSSATGTITG